LSPISARPTAINEIRISSSTPFIEEPYIYRKEYGSCNIIEYYIIIVEAQRSDSSELLIIIYNKSESIARVII